ncbi:Mur ligase [Fistulina hepatica ATCC 64428]|uniref:Mur ligase n=1 Tax=Fistulina hepatica ATCC 64428 TaxID=1128425 RepID=A0A0D7A364_9AGAR|nr:Mur ligase [Fistulina hepatica ATCC 64428]
MSIDLSLDRIRSFCQRVDPYTRPTIHIAGTNGKGSVAALVSSVLQVSGYRVGRYNSPHLIDVHDCITLNSVPISRGLYDTLRTEVERIDTECGTRLSSFELLTATALRTFEKEQVDIVVLEVGMGGRLDATNVIPDEVVLVSALTAVDLDHQKFLGSTVESIAFEKSSIARKGRPFVLGPQKHDDIQRVVAQVVRDVGGELVVAAPARSTARNNRIPFETAPQPIVAPLALHGDHQLDNAGLASTILQCLITHPVPGFAPLDFNPRLGPLSITRGFAEVRWPGRLTYHSIIFPGLSSGPIKILVDGAHNPASARTLASYIAQSLALVNKSDFTLSFILALSHSPPKTPTQTLSELFAFTSADFPFTLRLKIFLLRFTPPEGMPWIVSESPEEIAQVVRNLVPNAEVHALTAADKYGENLESALRQSVERSNEGVFTDSEDAVVVVAGSLYLVADFYRVMDKMNK